MVFLLRNDPSKRVWKFWWRHKVDKYDTSLSRGKKKRDRLRDSFYQKIKAYPMYM